MTKRYLLTIGLMDTSTKDRIKMKFNLKIIGTNEEIEVEVSSNNEYLFSFKADNYIRLNTTNYQFYINNKTFMRLSNVASVEIGKK